MADWASTLTKYALIPNPEDIPLAIRLHSSENTVTIFDAYPKATFHFLVLPRATPSTKRELKDLRSLLRHPDKGYARAVLDAMMIDAETVKKMVEDEMQNRYGAVWDVWMGFHAIQSMDHLHLHIISSDLCSPALKNKKHYNSFHPTLGFFIHLSEVLDWFEATPEHFKSMRRLPAGDHEHFLKEDLECWRCKAPQKNIPTLKQHLKKEWDSELEGKRRGAENA